MVIAFSTFLKTQGSGQKGQEEPRHAKFEARKQKWPFRLDETRTLTPACAKTTTPAHKT